MDGCTNCGGAVLFLLGSCFLVILIFFGYEEAVFDRDVPQVAEQSVLPRTEALFGCELTRE